MNVGNSRLLAEMRELRDRVVGVTDVAVGTVDGLLMAADTDDNIDPELLAALTAATVGLARRAGDAVGKGSITHTVAQFSDGYLVTQSVGGLGLMAVLGDTGLDMARLRVESQLIADRIGRLLAAQQTAARD